MKEINFRERKPFWLLVVIVIAFVLIFIYPEIVIFVFSIIYVTWGIVEGSYLIHKKKKLNINEQQRPLR
jgi:CDP-diacylglycerol--serine O-phosphatidyltransferase